MVRDEMTTQTSRPQPMLGVGEARIEVGDRRGSGCDARQQKSGEAAGETQMGRRWRFQARDSSDRAEATSGSGGPGALRLAATGSGARTRQC